MDAEEAANAAATALTARIFADLRESEAGGTAGTDHVGTQPMVQAGADAEAEAAVRGSDGVIRISC